MEVGEDAGKFVESRAPIGLIKRALNDKSRSTGRLSSVDLVPPCRSTARFLFFFLFHSFSMTVAIAMLSHIHGRNCIIHTHAHCIHITHRIASHFSCSSSILHFFILYLHEHVWFFTWLVFYVLFTAHRLPFYSPRCKSTSGLMTIVYSIESPYQLMA